MRTAMFCVCGIVSACLGACSIDFFAEIPCNDDGECPTGYGCAPSGSCEVAGTYSTEDLFAEIPCNDEGECPPGYGCAPSGSCEVAGTYCTEDLMVDFGSFSMAAHESSRPTATATSPGTPRSGTCVVNGFESECDTSLACSVLGVLPWGGAGPYDASAACARVGKRLCTEEELEQVCGAAGGNYPYGASYQPGACNDADGGTGAIAPTGEFGGCADSTGRVYDLVGNLGELTGVRIDSTGEYLASDLLQGGSFSSSQNWATCASHTSGAGQTQAGFRCCR